MTTGVWLGPMVATTLAVFPLLDWAIRRRKRPPAAEEPAPAAAEKPVEDTEGAYRSPPPEADADAWAEPELRQELEKLREKNRVLVRKLKEAHEHAAQAAIEKKVGEIAVYGLRTALKDTDSRIVSREDKGASFSIAWNQDLALWVCKRKGETTLTDPNLRGFLTKLAPFAPFKDWS